MPDLTSYDFILAVFSFVVILLMIYRSIAYTKMKNSSLIDYKLNEPTLMHHDMNGAVIRANQRFEQLEIAETDVN